jgi:hypothetical protein
MEPAIKLSLLACGIFFMSGLLTGVWKYLSVVNSPNAKAPHYVNIAHKTSLIYAFAALVLAKFVELSPYSQTVNLLAVAFPLFFFAFAIINYIIHGALRDTNNQFEKPHKLGKWQLPSFIFHSTMWLLIIGEIGGFTVLFVGFIQTLIINS